MPSTVHIITLLISAIPIISAFGTSSRKVSVNAIFCRYCTDHHCLRMERNENHSEFLPLSSTRREALSTVLSTATFLTFFSLFPNVSSAKDEIFKPNPLTNGILEQIRIWEQAEADNIKYDGELAPGSSSEQKNYIKLLIPVLIIAKDIDAVDRLVKLPEDNALDEANNILSKPQFVKKNFKSTFNSFADNIYYSDPDRANLYLLGGATPKNEQSIAYLLRNDILTNVENLQAEVSYLLKERKDGNQLEVDDLYLYAKASKDSMSKYLELVPPSEIKAALKSMP